MTANKKTTLKVTFTEDELKALIAVTNIFKDIYELSDKNDQVLIVNDKEETVFGANIVKNVMTCLDKLVTSVTKEAH